MNSSENHDRGPDTRVPLTTFAYRGMILSSRRHLPICPHGSLREYFHMCMHARGSSPFSNTFVCWSPFPPGRARGIFSAPSFGLALWACLILLASSGQRVDAYYLCSCNSVRIIYAESYPRVTEEQGR